MCQIQTPLSSCTFLKCLSGYLYKEFAAQADYKVVLDYAQQMGVVVWENASKRLFFTTVEGHSVIKAFIDRRSRGEA
jgi:transcription initiation factor TFIIH subunit 4